MPVRYYPLSKIKTNKITNGQDFFLDGQPYTGKYYETFDGKFFTGINPIVGENKKLTPITKYTNSPYLNTNGMSNSMRNKFAQKNKNEVYNPKGQEDLFLPGISLPPPAFKGEPTSHFPVVIPEDYTNGFINRYFAKRVNSNGYVIEISEREYIAIKNGEVPYDVSNYLTTKLMWKLSGPLNQKRISQYDIRAGIVDTNKRLVETAEKTFLGLVAFIGGEYSKYAKPTE